ncbi:LysR family transcriptional regulator [Burkholderia pyrrocinia]|nr:LysR family transcriptional regulator [Burkholderia pyrrocinia]
MDLFRAMRAFVITVQSGSMSAAATELGQSPALVGQHIAALEERLGTRLLNRTTRRQSLTEFGASYFEQCRDILDRVALSEELAEFQRTQIQGRLRITAPSTFGAEALMPALCGFRAIAPHVELDVTLTDRNVDLVEEGFDIAFRIGSLHDSRMVARPLMPYRMVVGASPAYLARMGSPAHPSELENYEAVAFTPSGRSPWKFTQGKNEVRVSPSRTIVVNSGQAVRVAALAGLGIVMQPEILLKRDVETGAIVQLFPDWHVGERPMWLLYYRDRRMTPRLRSFVSYAVSTFGSSSPKGAP